MVQALRKLFKAMRAPTSSGEPSDLAMQAAAFFNDIAARSDSVTVFDALYQALTVGHLTDEAKLPCVTQALQPYGVHVSAPVVAALRTDRVASHFSGLKGGKHRVKVEAVGAKAVFVALSKSPKKSVYHILRRTSDWVVPQVDVRASEAMPTASGRLPEELRMALRISVHRSSGL